MFSHNCYENVDVVVNFSDNSHMHNFDQLNQEEYVVKVFITK
jgi:hypothetical protein